MREQQTVWSWIDMKIEEWTVRPDVERDEYERKWDRRQEGWLLAGQCNFYKNVGIEQDCHEMQQIATNSADHAPWPSEIDSAEVSYD